MDQFNIRVDDDTKQMVTDMIDQWRQGTESNGDVFARIVQSAQAVGQDKPVELVKALSGSRDTVNVLLRQINSVAEVSMTQIEDLKKQLSEKEQALEDQATDWKKKLLQLTDDNVEKTDKLKAKVDELKDWLALATQSKAQSEKQLKDATVALQSCQDNLTDKKALIDKLNDDLNDRNNKIVELQTIVDQSEEKLSSELKKAAEKHRADTAKLEKQHQFELEQQRMQASSELEKVKAEKDAERSQAVAGKQEELYKQFVEERKELQQKLDAARQETQKKQELLDNLKDQLAAVRESNAVLKQQLQSQQKG